MRCSTCGEQLGVDEERCPTCGAKNRRTEVEVVVRHSHQENPEIRQCPRCGYHGRGTPYFSRPGHVAVLIGVSFFTYGPGGLVYWLARRKHRVCRNCGLGWEHAVPAIEPGRAVQRPSSPPLSSAPLALPSAGVKRRVFGTVLILLAAVMILAGLMDPAVEAIVVGSFIGAGGTGSFFWGWKALQERRQAVTTGLQRRVLQLATVRGGTLTVTEVATGLDLSLSLAEKVLVAMDDGFRVRSDITRDGVIVYEFPELLYRSELESGATAGEIGPSPA